MERGSGSEGRRRGGGQHMKCADRQMEELTEDKQTPCSHLVRHLRQAQSPARERRSVHRQLLQSRAAPFGARLQTPEEFEQAAIPATISKGATMSFFRHGEIYRPDGHKGKEPPVDGSPAHRSDESPADYSSASCSPAEIASASSAESYSEQEDVDEQ